MPPIRRSARNKTPSLNQKETDGDDCTIVDPTPSIPPEPDPPKPKHTSSKKSPPQKKKPEAVSAVNTQEEQEVDEFYWQDKVNILRYCSICLGPTISKFNHDFEFNSMDHIWSYVNPSVICDYVFVLGKEKDGKYLESKVPPLCASCKQNVKNLNKLHNDLSEITQRIQLEAGKIRKKIEDCNFKKESAKLESEMRKAKLPFRCMSNTIQFLEQLHKLNLAQANAPLNTLASESPDLRSSGTRVDTSDVKFEIIGGPENEDHGDEDADMDFMDNNDDHDYSPAEDSDPDPVVENKSSKSKSLRSSVRSESKNSVAEEDTSKDGDGQKCPLCVKRFVKQEKLRLHWWKVHKKEKTSTKLPEMINGSMKCKTCRKTYKHKYSFLFHLEMESEKCQQNSCGIELPCRICNKQFTSKKALHVHRTREHNSLKDAEFNCETCKRNFKTVGHLDRHIVLEHSEGNKIKKKDLKRHMCDICDKTFTSNKSLNEHRTIHTEEEKTFFCDVCGRSFRTERILKGHYRDSHWEQATGTPKPTCKFCMKSFSNPRYLRIHMKIHTEQPGFQCDLCGKEFYRRRNMLLHQNRVHLFEKEPLPIVNEKNGKLRPTCKICHKVYNDRRGLHYHMKMKHTVAGKRFSCEICEKKFGSKYELRYHHARFHVKGEESSEEVDHTEEDQQEEEIPAKKKGKTVVGVRKKREEAVPIPVGEIESTSKGSGVQRKAVQAVTITEDDSEEQEQTVSTDKLEVETNPVEEDTADEVELAIRGIGNDDFVDDGDNDDSS